MMLQQDLKPLFCIDITEDKNNAQVNGSQFITRTAVQEQLQELEAKQENLKKTVQKAQLPVWLRIIGNCCGFFFLIVFTSLFEVGFKKAFQNAPGLLIAAGVCGIIWLILFLIAKINDKKLSKDEKTHRQVEELQQAARFIRDDLNITGDAVDVDVIICKYKTKKGKIRPCAPGLQACLYFNANVKTYDTYEALHIADIQHVYSFHKSEMKSITAINKRFTICGWNKDELPHKGAYKKYKLGVNDWGVMVKPCYVLELEHDGERFGIYFPCYELEIFERFTGLKAV